MTALDLVDTVSKNTKGGKEGKIVMHLDCSKVWELLKLETLKASQIIGYGR